jgi:hypothetical protein
MNLSTYTASLRTAFRHALLIAALAIPLAGCFNSTFIDGNGATGAPSATWNERWYHGAVLGLVDLSGPISLDEVCAQGWARIDTSTSFLNSIAEGILSGLYSPQTVTIYCKGGAAYDAVQDGHGQVVFAIPHTR